MDSVLGYLMIPGKCVFERDSAIRFANSWDFISMKYATVEIYSHSVLHPTTNYA